MPRKRDPVWLDFNELEDKKYECLHCQAVMTGNATRMKDHLKICPIYGASSSSQSSDSSQPKMARFVDKLSKSENDDLQLKYARAAFSSGVSLSALETKEWEDFYQAIRPAFKRPSRKVLAGKYIKLEKTRVSGQMFVLFSNFFISRSKLS